MKRSKKVLAIITSFVLAMSLLLAGCGGGGTDGGGGTNSSASGVGTEIKTVKPGVITVASDCDYPPFISMNGEQPQGYEYELLEAIADAMGYELEYLTPQNFDTIVAAVAAGTNADVGCSSITIKEDRLEMVDFATPYFDSNQAAVALKEKTYSSAMDLNGKTVGAQSGTTGADWVRENLRESGTVLKEYNQLAEVMAALAAGDIEAAFFDEPAAVEQVGGTYDNCYIVEAIPTGEQYGICVSKDNPALTQAINEAMKTISQNGTFEKIFKKYFPDLTETQKQQFAALYDLYTNWNSKINVISRKDIENLYEHHVLHSLGIAKVINFRPGTRIMDLGTGGGFPGIPLAILFPEVKFHLVDSIGKKVRVATEVANSIGLKNVTFRHARAEEEKQLFDFVVSRAVMPLADLLKIIRKNIAPEQHNALPNGLICLKGGELANEAMPFKRKTMMYDLKDYFEEEFFKTKKVVYVTP